MISKSEIGLFISTTRQVCQTPPSSLSSLLMLSQSSQDHNENPAKPGEHVDAYAAFWAKLTGVKVNKPPRRYSAKNRYAKTITKELEELTEEAKKELPGQRRVTVWNAQLDLKWNSLSERERNKWQKLSDDSLEADQKEWKKMLKAPISKEPEQLQRYVLLTLVAWIAY